MERQRQELGLGNTNGRLAFYLIKRIVTIKGSHGYTKLKIYSTLFMITLTVHFLHREDSKNFRKESQFLLHNQI